MNMSQNLYEMLCRLSAGEHLHLKDLSNEERASASILEENGLVDIWVGGDIEITQKGMLALKQAKQQLNQQKADSNRAKKRRNLKDFFIPIAGLAVKILSFFKG